MKKAIVRVCISLAAIVIGLLIFATTKPATFRVQRSMNIKGHAGVILSNISDFHRWTLWSPYEKLDTAMKKTYSGAPVGLGSIYAWEGNNKIGKGRMEIIGADSSKISIKLDFFVPFEAHNIGEFILEPMSDSSTTVTWAMHGSNNYLGKVISVFMDMDKMVGKDFEIGLANLKTLVEK
jgi:hypothetical protein